MLIARSQWKHMMLRLTYAWSASGSGIVARSAPAVGIGNGTASECRGAACRMCSSSPAHWENLADSGLWMSHREQAACWMKAPSLTANNSIVWGPPGRSMLAATHWHAFSEACASPQDDSGLKGQIAFDHTVHYCCGACAFCSAGAGALVVVVKTSQR